jgi:hypothetical protein
VSSLEGGGACGSGRRLTSISAAATRSGHAAAGEDLSTQPDDGSLRSKIEVHLARSSTQIRSTQTQEQEQEPRHEGEEGKEEDDRVSLAASHHH